MERITLNSNLKQILSFILTITIILLLAIFLFFIFFINKDFTIRIIGTIAVLLVVAIWFLFEYENRKARVKVVPQKIQKSGINKIVLITRDGEREQEWDCNGTTSFLIGKSTTLKEADIDLTGIMFSEYVSNEHAVLNCSDGYWYIEDLGSLNGVGLKKKDEEYALKLKPLTSYKLDEGDIIYISKIKLYIR